MIKQCIQWLASKSFLLVDLLLIASMAGLLYASWPSLQLYSRWTAIALLAIMVLLAIIGLVALGGQVVFMLKRKAIDTQVYGRQQLSLPLSSFQGTKMVGDEQSRTALPIRPVKALPSMRRGFMRSIPQPVGTDKSSPQAVRTVGGHADGRTRDGGQIFDADTQADADRSKVLFYQQQYPGAPVRQTADAVGMGKTKVAEIIALLKREGAL